jgi:large subunit ribosomal protein L30
MADSKSIRVTLVKSLIGRNPKHLKTAKALGLKRREQTIEVADNPCMRGMINQISYLLQIEERV